MCWWRPMIADAGCSRCQPWDCKHILYHCRFHLAAWFHVHFGELPTQCLHVQLPGAPGLQQSLWWPVQKVLTRICKIHSMLQQVIKLSCLLADLKRGVFQCFMVLGGPLCPILNAELGGVSCDVSCKHPQHAATPNGILDLKWRKLIRMSQQCTKPRSPIDHLDQSNIQEESDLNWSEETRYARYRQIEGQEANFWKPPLGGKFFAYETLNERQAFWMQSRAHNSYTTSGMLRSEADLVRHQTACEKTTQFCPQQRTLMRVCCAVLWRSQ